MKRPLVLAITGASGAVYAQRLLEVLVQQRCPVDLTISDSGAQVIEQELGVWFSPLETDTKTILSGLGVACDEQAAAHVRYFRHDDFLSPLASGSSLTCGMVVCPCSGGTLSGIAAGTSRNLILRAAEVHLKERRKLVLVTRETPLSLVQLENMRRVCQAGAVVLPASPGWYHGVKRVEDLVDFVVARILDQFDMPHDLMQRWGQA